MRNFGFTLIGIILPAACWAQKMDPFDAHVADFRMLQSKNVQKDLGITTQELARLNVFADRNTKELADYRDQLVRQGKDPRSVPMTDPKLRQYFLELQNNILGNLSPQQLRRLRELTIQSVGIPSILDDQIAKRIGMSKAQVEKGKAIFEASETKQRNLKKSVLDKVLASYKNLHPKTQAEADALNKKLLAEERAALQPHVPELKGLVEQTKKDLQHVLTAKQFAAYKALEGPKFTLK